MAAQRQYVPDTSVVFKWYVTDRERNLAQARHVRDDFLQNSFDLLVPDVLLYELANLLRVAAEEHRISPREAVEAYADFEAFQIPVVRSDAWLTEALSLGITHRISVFDALFILVGMRSYATVVSDDERLIRAGQAVGSAVVRLADYR